MAKFQVTYENNAIRSVLTFRGREFESTMGDWVGGVRKSDKKCFSDQLAEAFPDEDGLDDLAEAAEALNFGDDDDIEIALAALELWEEGGGCYRK